MKKLGLLVLILVMALGVGCASKVQKDWLAVAGSKSDATITLAYYYNPSWENPQTSEQQAMSLATEKCQAWGYEKAEPFGSIIKKCTQSRYVPFAGVVCDAMEVSTQYQCVNNTKE